VRGVSIFAWIFPYTSEEETILGKMDGFRPKNRRRGGCHCKVLSEIRSVRDAFVTSIMWSPPSIPPVKDWISALAGRGRSQAYID